MPRWSCPDSWPASSSRPTWEPRPCSTSRAARPVARASISAYVTRRSRQTRTTWSGTAAATVEKTVDRLKPWASGPGIVDRLALEQVLGCAMLAGPRLQAREVALCEAAVLPLLIEDRTDAPAHRVALRRRVAGLEHRLGHLGEAIVGEAGDHLTDPGHPVRAHRQHLIEAGPCVEVSGHRAGRVVHLGVRQPERVVRRRVAEQRAQHPGVRRHDEVAQGLDERPLLV